MRAATAVSPTAQRAAEEVRAMMGRKQWSASRLAPELGISQPQVSLRVRGKLAWSLDELDTLAGLFGCSVADLIGISIHENTYANIWGLAA